MNNLDKKYIALLQDILDNGVEKKDRTGTGTLSVFGRQIRHSMKDGFPLLTTKKMYFKGIVTELLWFLRGDTNIKFLVDNDCHIWDGDAYKNFINKTKGLNLNLEINKDIVVVEGPVYNATSRLLTKEEFINKIKTDDEFAKKWGELGPVYGKQWRSWGYNERIRLVDNNRGDFEYQTIITTGIDQIANLINDLKTNPDSRRLMVNAWNVGELDQMVLPPCHYGFQVYTRELSRVERNRYVFENVPMESNTFNGFFASGVQMMGDEDFNIVFSNIPTRAISLMWNQRSVDTPLGLPFNIASYGLLLEIIAKEVNMVPDELIGNLGDTHIYLNQIEGIKEQLTREPFDLPTLKIEDEVKWQEGDCLPYYSPQDFTLENYQSHPAIKLPLSN
jgi:thymidylate synthase